MTRTTEQKIEDVVRLMKRISVGLVALTLFMFVTSYFGRVSINNALRNGCERAHEGRDRPLANALGADAEYVTSVTKAASVKEDVKRAARKKLVVTNSVAEGLRVLAERDCARDYPAPTPFG